MGTFALNQTGKKVRHSAQSPHTSSPAASQMPVMIQGSLVPSATVPRSPFWCSLSSCRPPHGRSWTVFRTEEQSATPEGSTGWICQCVRIQHGNAGSLPWHGGQDWTEAAHLLALVIRASTAIILLSTVATKGVKKLQLREQKTSMLNRCGCFLEDTPTPFSHILTWKKSLQTDEHEGTGAGYRSQLPAGANTTFHTFHKQSSTGLSLSRLFTPSSVQQMPCLTLSKNSYSLTVSQTRCLVSSSWVQNSSSWSS